MVNFCSRYLAFLREEGVFDGTITDGALPVNTIKISENVIPFVYKKPRLVYDKFAEKEKILIEPQVERLSYNAMKQLGFVIVARTPRKKWYSGQNVVYKVVREGSHYSYNSLLQIPPRHKIEYDTANKLIRILGRNAGPYGYSVWVDV